jgi:hypothetical protein
LRESSVCELILQCIQDDVQVAISVSAAAGRQCHQFHPSSLTIPCHTQGTNYAHEKCAGSVIELDLWVPSWYVHKLTST